jgi:hypothetical protein
MADFAPVLAAVDHQLETNGLARYLEKQRRIAGESLDDDEFVLALLAKLNGTPFTGTAVELLVLAKPSDPDWKPSKSWPATPRRVTKLLHRQAPVMRKAGWFIDDAGGRNHQKTTQWTIAAPQTRDARKEDPQDPQNPQHQSAAGLAGVAGQESPPLSYDPTGNRSR